MLDPPPFIRPIWKRYCELLQDVPPAVRHIRLHDSHYTFMREDEAPLVTPELVRPGQIILALSNPDPEIEPALAIQQGAAFAADGKSINNVLGFPGLFKGALAARATRFTDAMLLAAARKIAELAKGDDLVPDALDLELHKAVTAAVAAAA